MLTEAAIMGKKDELRGSKENVIVGRPDSGRDRASRTTTRARSRRLAGDAATLLGLPRRGCAPAAEVSDRRGRHRAGTRRRSACRAPSPQTPTCGSRRGFGRQHTISSPRHPQRSSAAHRRQRHGGLQATRAAVRFRQKCSSALKSKDLFRLAGRHSLAARQGMSYPGAVWAVCRERRPRREKGGLSTQCLGHFDLLKRKNGPVQRPETVSRQAQGMRPGKR